MIDLHSHILPGIDDGAKSWEIAVEMCQMAVADGVTHIVASPHANFEYVYDRERNTALLNELQAKVPELKMTLGCDFHLSYENIEDAMTHPNRYTIGDTRYLLVELSDYSVFGVADTLYKLQCAGLTPIITHPERNPAILRDSKLLQELFDHGHLMQITANSLTGHWGKASQKLAEQMLKKQMVHFISSDAHGLKGRPTTLSGGRDAAARISGEEAARRLVEDNPAAVVNNLPFEHLLPSWGRKG